ncbi:MAG: right-handed parallel beta-helix repeat-containing protein [Candidatus Omnitrophica bacterium]|nr:right-handed parallel beta-helix repeat-containing protein [Candidatus Omnitrophota bacterium]
MVAFTLLLFFLGTAWSQTYVNRVWHYPPGEPPYYTIEDKTYASSIAWTAAGGPYVCEAHVTVASGVLLTVESGALVEFVEGMGLYIEGDIQATGATFTRAGERYWRGIYLSPNSNASSLVGCTIRHAGGVGYCYNGCSGLGTYNGDKRFTSIYIDACSPVITGCVIEESWSNGIEVWRGGATIENNQFHNLGADSYALVVDVTDTYPQLAGNIASGTGFHGVSAPPGRWMSSGTWRKPGASFPYFLRGSMAVESGATLTLAPGVEVRAEGNIGVYVRGTLQALGSPGNPVVFTSRKTSPSQGDWNGIYLGPGAGGSVLSQCKILYAGGLGVCYYGCRGLGFYHGADRFAAVYIDGSAPQLLQCEIHHSYSNGIEAYGANPALIGISIQDCRENGLRMEADSHPTISNSALMSNGSAGYYAATQDASSTAEPNSVTFGGNTLEGVEIRGGRIPAPSIWRKWAPNAPYVMTGNTTLDPSAVLAIDPGVAVKTPDSTVGLYCHGVVIADGTPEPIVFTSLADDTVAGDTNGDGNATQPMRGDWLGIFMGPGADGSVLNQVDVRYAGSYGRCYYGCHGWENVHGADRFAALYVDSASPSITHCTITNSRTNGIEIWRGNPTLQGTRFHNMGNDGYPLVYSTTDTYPRMAGNVTSGTGYHAILVPQGRWRTSGSWNKPGESFPYLISGNVSVATDVVLTISAGTILRVANGVGFYFNGTLVADGTAREPIVFASADPTAVSEKWSGIYLGPQAGGSLLHFCSILHAGSWNWWTGLGNYHGSVRYTSLYFDNCSPMVACCTIGKTASGIEMYNSGALILSSVIFDSAGKGILCEGGSTPSILNNTVAENTRNGATGIATVNSSPILTNNIVAFNGTGISQTGSGTIALANNCVYGNGTNHAGLAPGATDLSEDPLFTGSAEGDFHLTSKSPCINAGQDGMTPPVTEDRDGKARPLGNHADIGAYEYGESETTVFEFGGAWCATGWHGLLDLNLNGEVDVEDLILLLRRWK